MSIVLDGSNGIQIPFGNVSSPPIRSSDEDTGIFFPTSTSIAITTQGTQRLVVNSNGQVDFAEPLSATTANVTNLNVSGTSTFSNDVTLNSQSDLRFADSDSSNYVALQAPTTIGSNYTLTLPDADGLEGQAIVTDGSGSLSFAAAGATLVNDTSTDASFYPVITTLTSGSLTIANTSTTKLYFNPSTGILNATDFNSLSDATLKKDIYSIDDALETINKITGIEFSWKDNDRKSAGVLAQDVEEVLPHLVNTNKDGIKSVNYGSLVAYLIQSVKELTNRIVELEKKG